MVLGGRMGSSWSLGGVGNAVDAAHREPFEVQDIGLCNCLYRLIMESGSRLNALPSHGFLKAVGIRLVMRL